MSNEQQKHLQTQHLHKWLKTLNKMFYRSNSWKFVHLQIEITIKSFYKSMDNIWK
jgi:hypothetical protein